MVLEQGEPRLLGLLGSHSVGGVCLGGRAAGHYWTTDCFGSGSAHPRCSRNRWEGQWDAIWVVEEAFQFSETARKQFKKCHDDPKCLVNVKTLGILVYTNTDRYSLRNGCFGKTLPRLYGNAVDETQRLIELQRESQHFEQ